MQSNGFIEGCYVVERHSKIVSVYLIDLAFELGQNESVLLIYASSPNLMIAVVILTVRRGYRNCALRPVFTRSRCSIFGLSSLGYPLAQGDLSG